MANNKVCVTKVPLASKFNQEQVFNYNPAKLWKTERGLDDTKCCNFKDAWLQFGENSSQHLKQRKLEMCLVALQKFYVISLVMQAKNGFNTKWH